jgi:uncharacterized protein YbjT (DUF2867 family)
MIRPKWVFTRNQPIAIRNVLNYLVDAIDSLESAGRIIEIGGRDVLTYAEMMTRYARVRGLRAGDAPDFWRVETVEPGRRCVFGRK